MQTKSQQIELPDTVIVYSQTDVEKSNGGSDLTFFSDTKLTIENDDIFSVKLSANDDKIKYVKMRWNTEMPVVGAKYLSDDWERSYGTLGFENIKPNRFMPWYFMISEGDKTTGYGVKVQPNAMCFWQADPAGLTLFLDVRNGGNGVELNGKQIVLAEVVSSVYWDTNSFDATKEFCGVMCQNPLLPDFPVYGSNNWYYAYGHSSADQIISDTDYVLEMTKKVDNAPFMVIDAGWQENLTTSTTEGGPWRKGNEKFPDMPDLANKLKKKGVRPGIWCRPLFNKDSSLPQEWRLPLNNCLDPSNPEVLNYIAEDIATFCKWGFKLIKHDFSTFDLFNRWGFQCNPLVTQENWNLYDKSVTNAQALKNLYKTILASAQHTNTLILGCNTVGHLAAGLQHISRIGDDTSGNNWERTRQIGINALAFRLPQHKKFFDVDADCVGILGKIDWKYNKQWAELVANSGTPLFVSAKPNLMSASEMKDLNEIMVTASKQDRHIVPNDWESTDCPSNWHDSEKQYKFDWFENTGVSFETNPARFATYLSIINHDNADE